VVEWDAGRRVRPEDASVTNEIPFGTRFYSILLFGLLSDF